MKRFFNRFSLVALHYILIGVCGPVYSQDFPFSDDLMTIDFEDADVREVLRAIGATYNLSIVVDPSVSGHVTVHVEDVPVIQGLESVVYGNGLRLEWRDGIGYVFPGNVGEKAEIFVEEGLLSADLNNADVRAVVQEVARSAGLNIAMDSGVTGTITGYISGLPTLAGLRGLLRANGFVLREDGNLYRVCTRGGASPSMGQQYGLDISVRDSLVYLDVGSADLGDVIHEMAIQSGANLVTYGSVAGEVSARLDGVSVEEALSILLRGTRFSYKREGSLLLVGDGGPQSAAAQVLAEAKLFPLQYAKATDVMETLPGTLPASQIKVVKEQNALLVTGDQELHRRMAVFLDGFDRPAPQVMIDALVVELSRKASLTLGVRAGLWGSTTGRELSPDMGGELHPEEIEPMLDDVARWLRVDSFGKLPDNFTVRIEALESQGDAEIKARPRVVTMSGHEAKINVGWVRWYQTSTGNVEAPITRLHSIDAGISLTIIPWVSVAGDVTVELHPMVSNLKGFGPEGLPEIARRTVDTTVRLKDGETVIIGGLIQSAELKNIQRLPILGHIPFLGSLFSHRTNSEDMSELVIFITPHVLHGDTSWQEAWDTDTQ
jgi:type IV pilus assembly protein PilQ